MDTERHHHDQEKLVTVRSVHNEVEASIIQSLLEAAGIRCALVNAVPHNVYPFTIDGLAEIRIDVLEADVEAAGTVLDDYEKTRSQQPDSPEDE